MNLYQYHPDPENAPGYATRYDTVPELVWERYELQLYELKKREEVLAKDAKYAYEYARWVLNGPFPAGEAALAKDAWYAYEYARWVLKGPFPVGEAVIAEDAQCAYWYARDVLGGPFPAGEATLAQDPAYSLRYVELKWRWT